MWHYVVMWIVSAVVSWALAPRQRIPDAQPGQIGDRDIPIASQDAPIPVLFGTRVLSQPNVVWWGDVTVDPIRRDGGKK
jgi:hypothetical protein